MLDSQSLGLKVIAVLVAVFIAAIAAAWIAGEVARDHRRIGRLESHLDKANDQVTKIQFRVAHQRDRIAELEELVGGN
jgi:hypothetical protein